jgi:Raf kinase inhibitor-like YbhB/YbcL family protein
MKLLSKAFPHEGHIPSLYTCDGKNINPPLEIQDVPQEAKALVLIMDDPDVPKHLRQDGLWVHWVVYNIPPTTRHLHENSTPPGILGTGTKGIAHYQGPCPPDREHRYYFKLYALKAPLNLKPGATKVEVEAAMHNQVLSETQLMGRFRPPA